MTRCLMLLSLMLLVLPVWGQQSTDAPVPSPEEQGRAVAIEADRRDQGFGDTTTELTMLLTNAEGRQRTRRLSWKTLEATDPGEGDKALTTFYEPRDIEGTAFLSYTHISRNDDQWLFLPSLKRVKRIASANKSSAFMGSEFAYEDLLSNEVEKFDYRWLKNEACGELQCFVIERKPRYENSGYTKQFAWLDEIEYRPIKTEFFDKKGRFQKTLHFEDYRIYNDRYWRAHTLIMENHLTGKTTRLTFSPFLFQTGLTRQDFEPSKLRLLR